MPDPSPTFPGPDTLCESCGYALKGLSPDGGCPECGLAIAESSPTKRTGHLWQTRPGPQAAFNVVIALMLNPRYFFRTMRIDGPNLNARLFLLLVVAFIGALWFSISVSVYGYRQDAALIQEGILTTGIVMLTYVEALGVTYFSRRRGWRVPFRLAERLVCYCSIGWVPVAIIMGITIRFYADGRLDGWMSGLLGVWGPWQSLELLVLIGAVSLLWFETLVWIGVRQTKYANG